MVVKKILYKNLPNKSHICLGNTVVIFEDKDGNGEITQAIDPKRNEVIDRYHYYSRRDLGPSKEENLGRPNPALQRDSFGMQWDLAGPVSIYLPPNYSEDNRYQYNGKELEQVANLLDYGWRWYDPVVGRFTGVDPIANQFPHVSPFNYAENEPIAHIDLWGLQKYFAPTGEFIVQNGNDESLRVVRSGSLSDCQLMTCSELKMNSVPVQVSTWDNKKISLANWASEFRLKSNEHAMGLYQATLTDSDGSNITAFVESSTVEGGPRFVDIGKLNSPIEGWKLTDVIHNHPYGSNPGAFSDEVWPPADIQIANRFNFNLFLTVRENDRWIGKFNPDKFKEIMATPRSTRMDALEGSINSRAIHIKFPNAFE